MCPEYSLMHLIISLMGYIPCYIAGSSISAGSTRQSSELHQEVADQLGENEGEERQPNASSEDH